MPKYLLIVDYRPGVDDAPMDQWKPDEIKAHMNYYNALNRERTESGELVGGEALTEPRFGRQVVTAPVEDLLRELAPQVLGVLTRRFGDFGTAGDAVPEALISAAPAV